MLNRIGRILRKPSDALTSREWEVVIAICVHRLDVHATADRLSVSSKAVWIYLWHIYRKLNVADQDELIDWYRREYPPTGLRARDYDDPDFEGE